ncbi:MAG: BACON domain-containing carbohydrate-binding protein [Acidobacteriota bacterium]|nr:BACON domain-containing carbohydrate-binding protein [Acidobacteriota bacterium]
MPNSANRKKLTVNLSLFLAVVVVALTASVVLPLFSASGQNKSTSKTKFKERVEAVRSKQGSRFRSPERHPKRQISPTIPWTQTEASSLLTGLPKELSLFDNNTVWPTFRLLDKHEDEGFDKPREAQSYFWQKRVPKGEKILSIEKYFEAQEQMRSLPQFSTTLDRFLTAEESSAMRTNLEAGTNAAAWTPLGPGNIGGRTRAFLINPQDPNIMYAAGVTGGVWKSTNAGQNWTPISDLIGNITVSSMVMEPGSPDTIYVGTGEGVYGFEYDGDLSSGDFRGAGIFKTTNGGMSWTRVPGTNTFDFYFVNDIVVSSNDKMRIYAATQSGVMRSLDGGATWTKSLDPIGSQGRTVNSGCLDLAIRTDKTTDVVFASCGNFEQALVYRNSDASGNAPWDVALRETGVGRTALAIAPSNQDTVYALSSSIQRTENQFSLYAVFRSTNGGDNWTAQVRNTDTNKINRSILAASVTSIATDCGYDLEDSIFAQAWFDLAIAVDPIDPNRVWVGGIELARSDDGGVNWGIAGQAYANSNFDLGPVHPDQHVIVFHPKYDGAANQTIFVANDGGLYRSDNARAGTATTPASACNPNSIAVKWTPINNNYGVTQFYSGAVSADGKTYAGGTQDNGTVLGTDAAGINGWKLVNGGDGGHAAIDQINANILFGTFPGINFRKSTDGGNSFGDATFGINDGGEYFVAPMVMDPSDSQRIWTGGFYLWRTTSSAAIWARASGLTAGSESVSAIAVAPTDSNRVLVGMGDGLVLRTDMALTSTSVTNWPFSQPRNGWVSSVAFDPNNKDIAYATYSTFGGAHVYRSIDGGQNWTIADGSLGAGTNRIPDIPVHSIAIDPSNTARLYVGTDLGVFVSNDGGNNWAIETTGFANVITEHLQMHVGGGITSLYAFTHGRGAWRTMVNNSGCSYSLSPATREINSDATTGTVAVAASPGGCNWTATSNASWLKVTGSGSADGTVSFQADANNTFASRSGTATIAGKTFAVVQPGRTDSDAPVVEVTEPSVSPGTPNISGLINLAGKATDNNAVTSVIWQSDRGAAGTAVYTPSTGQWTATGIPLSPGSNVFTITARDAASNIGRATFAINSTPDAVLVTVAGTGSFGATPDGGQAAAAAISRPWQIALDGAGNLFFTDTNNNTVRKIAPNGVISTVAGIAGSAGFSGDGELATAARLNQPAGVAVDGSGNVYISDVNNNRIRKITAADGKISTIAGTGQPGFSGDNGPATAAAINFPYGLTVDKDGNVFFADFSNHRIRKITAATGVISTVAGTGSASFNGDDKLATEATVNAPINVTLDNNGNLVIADSNNHRIRRINSADGKISTIAGSGTQGFAGDGGPATDARVSIPAGVVFDSTGNLYFADRGNSRVRKVAAGTNVITTIAGVGLSGFNGDGLAALASRLATPNSIAVDAVGNVYIGDRENFRVRRIIFASASDNAAPTIAVTAPTTTATFTTDASPLTVSGTATDNVGVYLVRWSNDRGGSGTAGGTTAWTATGIPLQNGVNNLTLTALDVRGNSTSTRLTVTFTPQQIISTFAGNGLAGNTGDGAAAVGARLFFPTGIAADADGNLYVADSANNRVRKITPAGVILPFAGNGMLGSSGDGGQAADATFNQPQSVAVDSTGNVYISDTGNHRIRKVAPSGVITTVAGTGTDGFSGDGGPATQALLNLPFQVAVDSAGNLFIADASNRRVRKVTVSTGVITTIAGDGRVGTGGDGGEATKAQFLLPYGVTVDRSGVIYILDAFDGRVRRVATNGTISNYVGTGNFGYRGDGGPATSAEIDPQSFITTDADGNLYIADLFNHVIRKVTATTGIISTVVGTGVGGFSGDGSAPRNAQLAFPNDVAFDRSGNMYIADLNNQRVRKIINAGTLKTVASVSAASFQGETLTSDMIAAAFGSNLATSVQVGTTVPLPTTLGNTSVRVRDALGVERLAPLFFVAPTQINFLVPSGTSNGAATVTIVSGDGTISTGVAQIGSVAPGLFSANADGQGVAAAVALRIRANGQQIFEPVTRFDATSNRSVAVPIDLGPDTDQVFLIAYLTGARFRSSLTASSASVGGENAELLYLGLQGDFVGLDQANIRLSRNLIGKGDVDVKLIVDGKTSNTVRINIK